MLLHAGPPIAWADMCGPMQGPWSARSYWKAGPVPEDARETCRERRDHIRTLSPSSAVGPMAGVISPSMPVWIVRDGERGHRDFLNLNEGLGKALRFGANGPEVLERLDWMAGTLRKALAARAGGLGTDRIEAADRSGAAHGRRGAQPQRRGHVAVSQATGSGAAQIEGQPLGLSPRHRLHRRQRSLLPEYLDGGLQGDDRRGARRPAVEHGHGDGAQRRRVSASA